MKAIILAGGRGTRLSSLTKNKPKPMVSLLKKPLIQYQIELLKKYGITDITLITSYLSSIIKDYLGDGRRLGVKINYFEEKIPLGTAGSIREIASHLKDDFLVLYGDLLINMDIRKLVKYHKKNKGIATLVVHPNNHPFDSDIIEVNENSKIIAIHPKPHDKDFLYANLVSAAIYVFTPEIANFIPKSKFSDFGGDIFPQMISRRKKLFAYKTREYIKDIGTIERLFEAKKDIKGKSYQLSNISNTLPAIFFDRDGVINEEVDNVRNVEDVKLLKKSTVALRKVNNSLFLVVVISNQPQAAKGLCTIDVLKNINKKVETLLGNEGVKIDGLYFCPHHPEKGFPGENKKYKVICECRKPKTKMISQAVKDFNINLNKSYMIGDTTSDAMTAKNAGIPFIGVKTGYGCKDRKYSIEIPLVVNDIKDAVNFILKDN